MFQLKNIFRISSSSVTHRSLTNVGIHVVVAASLAALSGCLMANEDPALGRSEGKVISANALSPNGLSYNGLSYNGLSYNGLSYNGLGLTRLDGNIVVLADDGSDDMADSEGGRELLEYIARCALGDGDFLRVESSDGQTWDYPGSLGLATEWESEPLDAAGQEIMTACLLSLVNAFDISVPVSLRTEALLPAEGEETAQYFYGDGAFYGNLFADSSPAFACQIRARDYIDPATGEYVAASSPHAADRVCAGETTAAECNMVFTGYCDEVCDVMVQDGDQWRFSGCLGADGVRYDNTISVWLQGEQAESCVTAPDGFTCEPQLAL